MQTNLVHSGIPHTVTLSNPRPNPSNNIDRDVVRQIVEDLSLRDLHHLVTTFETDLQRLTRGLAAAGASGDLQGWLHAAHAIAGASSALGAVALEGEARAAMAVTSLDTTQAVTTAGRICALADASIAGLHGLLTELGD